MSYDSRYDAYDSRHSRRHDSFTKQRDSLRPECNQKERTRERSRSRSRLDPRYADGRAYEQKRPSPTRSYTRPHDEKRTSPTGSYTRSYEERSRNTRAQRSPRITWPPQPMVESESRSLSREIGGDKILRNNAKDEIPSRGTVDQDPLILDVPEFSNLRDRRFVHLSDEERGKSKGIPTPPTSEDERLKKMKRRPSRINTDRAELPPELQKRTASPYSSSKPDSARSRGTADLLSPHVLTPPVGEQHHRRQTYSADTRRRSPQASPTISRKKDYFDAAYPESAVDDSYDVRSRRDDAGKADKAGLGISSANDPSSRSFVSSSANAKDKRQPEVQASSAARSADKAYRPSPLVVASTLSEALRSARETPRSATLNPPDFVREPSSGSRQASPVPSLTSQRSASPPPSSQRSSRHSADYSYDQTRGSPDLRKTSAAGSRTNSRPSTPPLGTVSMPRIPQTNDDWSELLANNAARRGLPPKMPSKLSTSTRADSMPTVPRSASYSRPTALPYPINDGPATPDIYMPQEQDHQFFAAAMPAKLDIPEREPARRDRAPSPTSSSLSSANRPARQSRHSFTTAIPTEIRKEVSRPEPVAKVATTNAVGPTKQEADSILARGLPACQRSTPTADYDDWYTLLGAPDIDFCPDCVEKAFDRTVYRNHFRRSVPRDRSIKKHCAFGTPWIRLAYLITVQQRMSDLRLIKDMAEIDADSTPCPKHEEAVHTWHGVRDDKKRFVRDFQICYTDVRKLERLLPRFIGFFPRLPDRAAYEKKRCALRVNTNRFDQYLGAIVKMDAEAYERRRTPDPMSFVSLVERKLSLRECERDVLLLDGMWHYMPHLQEFTVCEDCFEDVVEPEIKKGSELAKRFNRTVAPAYGEDRIGTSCQLYSPRMRKVFSSAVKDNDLKYLARKAKERREAELRLQGKLSTLMRRAQRYEYDARGSGSDDEKRRIEKDLQRDVHKISDEWKVYWE